jgi:hypothetical protein
MIRGKAFEFTALLTLQDILPTDEFDVSNCTKPISSFHT